MNSDLLLWLGILALALFGLIKASQYMISSSEKIGLSLGVPPFIIGVLLLAIGTSLPELLTSIIAATTGNTGIITGNVVGSNVANIFFILGITTVISRTPLKMGSAVITTDLYFLISSAILFTMSAVDNQFTPVEGLISLAMFGVYLVYIIRVDHSVMETPEDERPKFRTLDVFIFLGSAVLLYFSAEYTIKAVVFTSNYLDIGEDIIATTVVALGTSLPELVVSLQAVRTGNSEMAIGNILGSSIFNLLMVMGVGALFGAIDISDDFLFEVLPFMLVATLLSFFMSRDKRFTRWEGYIFLIFYFMFVRVVMINSLMEGAEASSAAMP